MEKVIEVVYEHGVFRPLAAVELKEGQQLKVRYQVPPQEPPPGLSEEERLRWLGFGIFDDVPDELWDKISEGWKRE